MTRATTLEVRRNDLARTRLMGRELPSLQDGAIELKIERFALTANNITYGVVGEKLGYWNFFPAADGWGVIPVWGVAEVSESSHPNVDAGERLYGYFPMGTHLVMRPGSVTSGSMVDSAPHRSSLPAVYNSYARISPEPGDHPPTDEERMLLMPLYATSFCLYDFLLDNDWFGARQIVILSASSKTAIGLALALSNDAASPQSIALTSQKHRAWVDGLGFYGAAFDYGDLSAVDAALPTVVVDMSGNGSVLSELHARLGDNMRYCANVGMTHYDETAMGPSFIAERSAMFFAPGHISKRSKEWGPGVFQKKMYRFWREAALQSRSWLRLERYSGPDGLQDAYQRVLAGEIGPDRGVIVEHPESG